MKSVTKYYIQDASNGANDNAFSCDLFQDSLIWYHLHRQSVLHHAHACDWFSQETHSLPKSGSYYRCKGTLNSPNCVDPGRISFVSLLSVAFPLTLVAACHENHLTLVFGELTSIVDRFYLAPDHCTPLESTLEMLGTPTITFTSFRGARGDNFIAFRRWMLGAIKILLRVVLTFRPFSHDDWHIIDSFQKIFQRFLWPLTVSRNNLIDNFLCFVFKFVKLSTTTGRTWRLRGAFCRGGHFVQREIPESGKEFGGRAPIYERRWHTLHEASIPHQSVCTLFPNDWQSQLLLVLAECTNSSPGSAQCTRVPDPSRAQLHDSRALFHFLLYGTRSLKKWEKFPSYQYSDTLIST